MKTLLFFVYKLVAKKYNAISVALYGKNGKSITELTWR